MKVLITGITGTIAPWIFKYLKDLYRGSSLEIHGISRDEYKQSQLKLEDCELHICDVRDYDRLQQVSRGMNLIIHTAALKHVDLMEKFPEECIKTNILGTMNICKVQKANHISKVVFLSTDKAVQPINVYGMSKGISEKLILSNDPKNLVVRYGNVFNSRGSFISNIKRCLKEKQHVTVTDYHMTRFWIKIEQAAEFIVSEIIEDKSGLSIPPMKASSIYELLKSIENHLEYRCGQLDALTYEHIGLRKGEKINEILKLSTEKINGPALAFENTNIYSDLPSVRMSPNELNELVFESFKEL